MASSLFYFIFFTPDNLKLDSALFGVARSTEPKSRRKKKKITNKKTEKDEQYHFYKQGTSSKWEHSLYSIITYYNIFVSIIFFFFFFSLFCAALSWLLPSSRPKTMLLPQDMGHCNYSMHPAEFCRINLFSIVIILACGEKRLLQLQHLRKSVAEGGQGTRLCPAPRPPPAVGVSTTRRLWFLPLI